MSSMANHDTMSSNPTNPHLHPQMTTATSTTTTTTVKKRKASDAGVGPGVSHPLGGNSGFGYPATSSTTPLQPPKLKAIKKRKTKETSVSGSGTGRGGSGGAGAGGKLQARERSTREFTPTDEENNDDDDDAEDDDDDDDEGRGQATMTGNKLSEAYRRLQSRRDESKEASEAEGSQAGGGKKSKRNRVHFSCVECHRRKQKCDRNEPCGQCIARKVPNLCRPFINGVEDPTIYDSDIKARLTRIEDVLATLITRLPAPSPPEETPDHHTQTSSSSRHAARVISSPRPIAPAPPGVVAGTQSNRNRIRNHHHLVRRGSSASADLGGSTSHAALQLDHHHRHMGHSGVHGAGAYDVRATLGTGMEGIMQNNGSEEVFHPKGSGLSNIGYPTYQGPGSGDTQHTPPVPLYFSAAHSHASPTDHPSPHSGSGSVVVPGLGRIRITLEPASPELNDILQTLSESGITKGVLVGLLMDLPDKALSDILVDLYFREIDWTRYKMNRPLFMKRYTMFFESIRQNPSNPHIDADTLKWLPLMYITLAIATLSAPVEMVGGPLGQKSWSRRFYGSSRSALTCAKALQRDNLDIVYASLLSARFMFLTRRAAEGSTPLTSAFQLGLYRDGSVLNLMDKREVELRRRAWAMVYHLDRTNALLVGRPTSISDAHTDTKEPANLDDEELESPDFDPRGHSLIKPTEYTQVILRHRLAQIMGRISDHTFAIKPPDYSMVLKLDQELLDWQSKLPPFFALFHPDTSLDQKYRYIFVQRHLLACEFLFARITLHRPYLLRKRDVNNQYRYSREAAIESAKADLLGRRAFMFEKPEDTKVNSGGYRVLNSYIVLGVAIKMEPNSTRAEELRRLLDVVAGLTPDELGRISEPIVKDELAIVEFLTQRANDPSTSEGVISNSAPIPPYHILSGEQRPALLERRGTSASRQSNEVAAFRQQHASDDPAWSFVAPGMATLDVHAPFSPGRQANRAGSDVSTSSMPGPLRPPPPRGVGSQSGLFSDREGSIQNNFGTHGQNMQSSPSRSQVPQSPYQNSNYALQGLSQAQEQTYSHEQQGLGGDFTVDQSPMPNLDAWWNDVGGNLAMSQNTPGNFNPFALAQFGHVEEGDSNETAFLNMLLSTIANSSGPGSAL